MLNLSQINLKFPKHWQHLSSRGAGHFITQIIHKLPNGNLHIWTSRRFRKRHSTEIRTDDKIQPSQRQKKKWKYWDWKLQSLTWWIGFIFTVGSILFVIGSIPMMFPNPPEHKIALINFLGSVCFTIGSYAALLETINLTAFCVTM